MKPFRSISLRRVVLALCAAAFCAIATPARAHHGGAHFLDVYSVTCYANNDPWGAGGDDPYIKLNGSRIWTGPECNPTTTMYPGIHTTFWNQVALEVMEDDFGSDDLVLYQLVGPQSGQGTQTVYSTKWIDGLGLVLNYGMEYAVYQ